MPLYLCRWPNEDFSFVSATSKEAAVEALASSRPKIGFSEVFN